MKMKMWMVGLVGLAFVAGWNGLAFGATAYKANVTGALPAYVEGQNWAFGWTFQVTGSSSILVTHVGVYDQGGDGLATAHEVGIWYGATLMASIVVPAGTGGEYADGYRYIPIDPPLELAPDPIPPSSAYSIGVLFPGSNADDHVQYATVTFDTGGIIVPWSSTTYPGWYSRKSPSSVLVRPGTGPGASVVSDQQGLVVNFRYELPTPVAEAGANVTIYSSEQGLEDTGEPLTTISGTATDPYPGPQALTYRWLKDGQTLCDWTSVGANGEASLGLAAPVPVFAAGVYTLTLEVTDGAFTVSDAMTLAVVNTPPEGQPSPTEQTLEIGVDAIIVGASVADFDGDAVSYQWVKDGIVIDSGTVTPSAGGTPVVLNDLTFSAGDSRFVLGSNQVQLIVNDGVNPAVTETVTVTLHDTTAPTLSANPSVGMLWPPNHQLIPVTIWATTEDNGGGAPVLTANVQCNEVDGDTDLDWYVDSIDGTAGTISLRLRAERTGSGDGRVYTVSITATDGSGNSSSATVDIRVPHDRRKK
ncbi:MAG: hypothetical protein ACM3VT_12050 [Solirubrobacterales bacterium]